MGNDKTSDAVLVPEHIVEGLGARIKAYQFANKVMTLRATITKLNPHPECASVEVIPPALNAYKPKQWTPRAKVCAGERSYAVVSPSFRARKPMVPRFLRLQTTTFSKVRVEQNSASSQRSCNTNSRWERMQQRKAQRSAPMQATR